MRQKRNLAIHKKDGEKISVQRIASIGNVLPRRIATAHIPEAASRLGTPL